MAIVKTLIDSGDTKILNKVTKNGWTGLHWACNSERLDVVQFLVDQMDNKQMNINVTNNKGNNALVCAIQHEEVAKVLLQTGKLELENMKGVSDYMKNLDGSIVFNFYDTENNYVIKMDSLKVVNSIAFQMGDNSSCNENPNETIPAFEPRFDFFNILLITRFNNQFQNYVQYSGVPNRQLCLCIFFSRVFQPVCFISDYCLLLKFPCMFIYY